MLWKKRKITIHDINVKDGSFHKFKARKLFNFKKEFDRIQAEKKLDKFLMVIIKAINNLRLKVIQSEIKEALLGRPEEKETNESNFYLLRNCYSYTVISHNNRYLQPKEVRLIKKIKYR